MKLFLAVNLLVLLFKFSSETNIPCKNDYATPVVRGTIYRCYIENNLQIDSKYSAYLTSASGSHYSGKTNDDVLHFKSYNNKVDYFPKGLEKIFKNLIGVHIEYGGIKEIRQSDLIPFPNLAMFYIEFNQLETLEDGLFDFNPNLESVSFLNNKIFYIGSTVFDNLPHLTFLWLDSNKCIDRVAKNSHSKVLEVVVAAKNQCTNSNYWRLYHKLANLTYEVETQNIATIRIRLNELDVEFGDAKIPYYLTFKRIIQSFWCGLLNPTESGSTTPSITALRTTAPPE